MSYQSDYVNKLKAAIIKTKEMNEPYKNFLQTSKNTLFKQQIDLIEDTNKYKMAICGRRSGKTFSTVFYFIKECFKADNSFTCYVGLTRESAARNFWLPLKAISAKFKLGIDFKESNLSATFPNGSVIFVLGANNLNVAETLRGAAWSLVVFDEAASYRSHLQNLVEDIVTPALVDKNGTVMMIGSPSDDFASYFYKSAHDGTYSTHSWTMFQNPHLPNPRSWLDDYMKRKGLSESDALIQREYFGKFVRSSDKTVYKYSSKNIHFGKCPLQNPIYVIGIDFGFNDSNAITVLAFNPSESNVVYVVYQFKQSKQTITDFGHKIVEVKQKYNAIATVADTGGGGRAIVEDLNMRFALNLEPAIKTEKLNYIQLANDQFRTNTLQICRNDSEQDYTDYEIELMNLYWKDETHKEENGANANHLCDSSLYALKYTFAYLNKYHVPEKIGHDKLESDFFNQVLEKTIMDSNDYFKY